MASEMLENQNGTAGSKPANNGNANLALAKALKEAAKAKSDLQIARANIATRYQELAKLTLLAKAAEDANRHSLGQRDWLIKVYSAIDSEPRWWSYMPSKWVANRRHARLRGMNLFDAKGYLSLYPDISVAGMEPLRHYILHGMAEGRNCVK